MQLPASSALQLEESIKDADLTIGAVLIPGALAPKLVTREMLRTMKESLVFVDVAIDQGGCAETSKPTTHDDPVHTVDGVIHYCVANMPGGSITSTRALTNVTPVRRAARGSRFTRGCGCEPDLARGVNTRRAVHVRGGRGSPAAWSTRRWTTLSPPAWSESPWTPSSTPMPSSVSSRSTSMAG